MDFKTREQADDSKSYKDEKLVFQKNKWKMQPFKKLYGTK